MQTAARNNLVLTEFPSLAKFAGLPAIKYEALYQQVICGLRQIATGETIHQVARHLGELAHHAYEMRQFDTMRQASRLLGALPEPSNHIGEYYQAMYLRHHGNIAEAKLILERVAEKASLRYRARAVQFLGAIAHTTGRHQDALPFYFEAIGLAASGNWCDPHTTATALQNIAMIRSIAGDHRAALADLERLFPLVRAIAEPYKYHHYLNSYAVELGEAGHIEEAHHVSRIVLASPYAFAYPEWRETANDIALRGYRSRSVTSFRHKDSVSNNVLRLPAPEPARSASARFISGHHEEAAQVFDLLEWKKKMGKEPNGNPKDTTSEEIGRMTNKELLVEILQRTSSKEMSENKLRKILEYVLQVESEPED